MMEMRQALKKILIHFYNQGDDGTLFSRNINNNKKELIKRDKFFIKI